MTNKKAPNERKAGGGKGKRKKPGAITGGTGKAVHTTPATSIKPAEVDALSELPGQKKGVAVPGGRVQP